jgi:hypothetical protein
VGANRYFTVTAGELEPEQSEQLRACSRTVSPPIAERVGTRRNCLRTGAEDGPARLFLERAALLRSAAPPSDWGGIWRIPRNDD